MGTTQGDSYWMGIALEEARKASVSDEIPVGAVVVKNSRLCSRNHNRTRELRNPLAHAEKLVIEEVLKIDKYLYDYTLYVTLEPCLMCSGIIMSSRVGRVVYSAFDKKSGVCGSIYYVLKDKNFNHSPEVVYGVRELESSELLKKFFKSKR